MSSKDILKEQLEFDGEVHGKKDHELYQMLLDHLNIESDISIKPTFAEDIKLRLQRKHKKETMKENILFSFAILGVIAFGFVSITAAAAIFKNSGIIPTEVILPVVVVAGMIVLFQTIDHRLIRRKKINKLLS